MAESLPERVSFTEWELAIINAKLSEMRGDIEVLKQDSVLIKAILGAQSEDLENIETKLDQHTERFDSVDRTLAEILRRLPDPPA